MSRFTEQQFIRNLKAFHEDSKGTLDNECGIMRLMWKKTPEEERDVKYTTHGFFFIPDQHSFEGSLSWMVREAVAMYEYRRNCGGGSENNIGFLFETNEITGTELTTMVEEYGNLKEKSDAEKDAILRLSGHNGIMRTRFPRFQLINKQHPSVPFLTTTCDANTEWWLFKAMSVPLNTDVDISEGMAKTIFRELKRCDGLPNVNTVLAFRGFSFKQTGETYMQIIRRPHGQMIFDDLYVVKERED